ncbi:hypothetical protein ACLBKU_16985 [Erythrobacter sp. NE805]|uniref:hypothetical protein n=1 Tax=Erythrobacter sp. NE805 TaxID=3389875 RepID=UPI00396B3F62
MRSARYGFVIAALALAGCASDDPLAGQRTVFSNPVTGTVIDPTGVGPQCEVYPRGDTTCVGVPLTRSGRGTTIGEHHGLQLTDAQRRVGRQQAELLRERIEALRNPPAPAPLPTAPPIAEPAAEPSGER